MSHRYLYLVRHGQFDADTQTNPNGDLTPVGKRQARYTAKAFKGLPISAIHVSTLTRALQTAEPLAATFPEAKLVRARRLIECIPPLSVYIRGTYFEHISDEDLAKEVAHAERAYSHYVRCTRGPDKHEILITHGNLIRYLVCRILDIDVTLWPNLVSRNCGITRIQIDPDGSAELISFNEIGHLPPDLHSDNV